MIWSHPQLGDIDLNGLSDFVYLAKTKNPFGNFKKGRFRFKVTHDGQYHCNGRNIVECDGVPIWGMVYSGRVNPPLGMADSETRGFGWNVLNWLEHVIKRGVPKEFPVRGPINLTGLVLNRYIAKTEIGTLEYDNMPTLDKEDALHITNHFTGVEKIYFKNTRSKYSGLKHSIIDEVFRLDYSGGLIDSLK